MTGKVNLKDKINDGEIDLSLCELTDVPVKEIASVRNVYSLDLSDNHLVKLPNNFVTLTNLTKLDLSKNQLRALPEEFGNLSKLKYLDLYKNQLEFLPITFYKLKALRWLDLKDNPLPQTVLQVSGPCLDAKECQKAAVEIVKFYTEFNDALNLEMQRREEQRQKDKMENQQKIKAEKKSKKKEKKPKIVEREDSHEERTMRDFDAPIELTRKTVPATRWSLLKTILTVMYVLGVTVLGVACAIFLLTALRYQWAVTLKGEVAKIWQTTLDGILSSNRPLFTKYGESVGDIHQKYSDNLYKFFNYLENSDSINRIRPFFGAILDVLVHCKNVTFDLVYDVYTKFFSTD